MFVEPVEKYRLVDRVVLFLFDLRRKFLQINRVCALDLYETTSCELMTWPQTSLFEHDLFQFALRSKA